jgi:hypothetical protein
LKGRRTETVEGEPVEEEPVEERPSSASVTRVTGFGKTAVPLFQTNKEKERQQVADTLREREREREVMVPCNIIP